MSEPVKRPAKPISASSSISDLSFEDVKLEEAQRVSSNRTGSERSGSVGLPPSSASGIRPEPSSPFAAAAQVERKQMVGESPVDEISWRGGTQLNFALPSTTYSPKPYLLKKLDSCAAAPPAEGPALQVDAAALRENLATFAGQAANTAGQAANTVRRNLLLVPLTQSSSVETSDGGAEHNACCS